MAEREGDQPWVSDNEPADDFPSECNPPPSSADVPRTRRVLQGGQVVLITLSSTDWAKDEFLSERDLSGREAGPLLEIVPVENVGDRSLADTLTGSSTEARAATRAQWVSTAVAAFQEVSSISRISIGLAVAALGGVIYAALAGHIPGVSDGTASRIVVDPVVSREAAITSADDGTASRGPVTDPFNADADSREASELARLNSDRVTGFLAGEVSARPEGITTEGERRSAGTEGVDQKKPSDQPEEVLVSQLESARDVPVVAGTLPAPVTPEPGDEAVGATDVARTSTTTVPKVAELVTTRAANERLDEAPPILPPSGDAGLDAPPASTANNVVVQAVLARYASAYERLDASAVKDVWPTVDERALARAFNDLDSQSIVFDACDLTIAGTRATASCRGTARFTTSVGKRSNVMQTRQWTFLLEQSPERWEIQQVQVR
jgi:hypothetical protein